jgi:hypothetical protein
VAEFARRRNQAISKPLYDDACNCGSLLVRIKVATAYPNEETIISNPIDRFESVFRSADKPQFRYQPPNVGRILVLTDSENKSSTFHDRVSRFLSSGDLGQTPEFRLSNTPPPATKSDFLKRVEADQADIVVTHRHLYETFTDPNLGLGTYPEALLQCSTRPLLILPHYLDPGLLPTTEKLEDVLVISDHFSNSDELINWSAKFVSNSGSLWLTHVESEADFDRYMKAIERIPELDTDIARTTLRRELLHESNSYIHNCKQQLSRNNPQLTVEILACMGHPLDSYRQWLNEEKHEMLVIPALGDDAFRQRALANHLAEEFPQIALLLV